MCNVVHVEPSLLPAIVHDFGSLPSSSFAVAHLYPLNALADENELLKSGKSQSDLDNANLKAELEKVRNERAKLAAEYEATSNNLKTLQNSYDALEKNSDEALKANMDKNRELLAQLEAKEKAAAKSCCG